MKYAILILILMAGVLSADESKDGKSYICIPDKATGFAFNDSSKTWEQTNFRVSDSKYIVRPLKEGDSDSFGDVDSDVVKAHKYGVWNIGKDNPRWLCEKGIEKSNWLKCATSFSGEFTMNSRTLRFIVLSDGTYTTATMDFGRDEDGNFATIDVEDTGGDSPYVEIGKCSAL